MRPIRALLFATAFFLVLSPSTANAVTTVNTGFSIDKPTVTLQGTAGETIAFDLTIKPTGTDQSTHTVTVESLDFSPGTDGAPVIITDGENTEYGLKNWVQKVPQLTIGGKQPTTVRINIDIPSDTADGTYYGLVVFGAVNGSVVTQKIASVILVDVGTATYNAGISSVKASLATSNTTGPEATIEVLIQNTGDFMFLPSAVIHIKNDDTSATTEYRPYNKGNTLPGSSRLYTYTMPYEYEQDKSYTATVVLALPDGQTLEQELALKTAPLTAQDLLADSERELEQNNSTEAPNGLTIHNIPKEKEDHYTLSKSRPITFIAISATFIGLAIVATIHTVKKKSSAKKMAANTTIPSQSPGTSDPPVNNANDDTANKL